MLVIDFLMVCSEGFYANINFIIFYFRNILYEMPDRNKKSRHRSRAYGLCLVTHQN